MNSDEQQHDVTRNDAELPSDIAPDDSGASDAQAIPAEMTPGQLAEAKQYNRLDLWCSLADMAIDIVYLGAMAILAAKPLEQWLAGQLGETGWMGTETVRLAALYAVVFAMHLALSAPLSFYSGFVLEHRFGLSRQSFISWLRDFLLHNTMGFVFNLLMFCGLFWVVWTSGAYWWLLAAAGWFIIAVLMGQLAPVVIMPLFYTIKRLEDSSLVERLTRLTQGTGLTLEGVYRIVLSNKTVKANAMLAGLGRTRRVMLGDTLLDSFTPEEVEVVFAHEIGHHVHHHIRKMILSGVAYALVGFYVCDRVLASWIPTYDPTVLPVYALPMLMFCLLLFMRLTEPIQNAMSRHNEREADLYAIGSTGQRGAFISAFHKLARINKADPHPHPLEVFLFHSHPPITERIAAARE